MPSITTAPPYSIIFVCDNSSEDVEVPDRVAGELVAANDTCISVGTYPADDGDTELCLTGGPGSTEQVAGLENVFTGRIASPNQRMDVATAENEVLLSMKISTHSASISVWVNDPRWPTKILIAANGIS
jgi:hypothetical protein